MYVDKEIKAPWGCIKHVRAGSRTSIKADKCLVQLMGSQMFALRDRSATRSEAGDCSMQGWDRDPETQGLRRGLEPGHAGACVGRGAASPNLHGSPWSSRQPYEKCCAKEPRDPLRGPSRINRHGIGMGNPETREGRENK